MSRSAPEAPAAATEAVEPESPRDHSGRLLVRMPKSLHAELARTAERDGTSLNAFIVGALSGAVGWRSPAGGRPEGGRPEGGPPEGGPPAPEQPAAAQASQRQSLSLALKANLVVLVVATAVAIALLVTAWQG